MPEDLTHDIDNYLRFVEKSRQIEPDFLKSAKIDGRMRGILLDWMIQIQVSNSFGLSTIDF
jgi:hypothetical protein